MTSTTAVMMAPTVLMTRDRYMCRRAVRSVVVRSSRFQCRIMPVWLHTNDTNTPTM